MNRIIVLCAVLVLAAGQWALAQALPQPDALRAAADYSREHDGLSLLVMRGGQVIFEAYHNGHAAGTDHRLASATKSFAGGLAAAAVEDGLLDFDEPASNTITEWQADPQKSKITVRHILSLTSGIRRGGQELKQAKDWGAFAITLPLVSEPGEKFQYGPVNYAVFSELMKRKLAGRGETPYTYFKRRIADPIGMEVARWGTDRAGNHLWNGGASLTARQWIKYGEMIRQGGTWNGTYVVGWKQLSECFAPNAANPSYGLTFWLNTRMPAEMLASGALELPAGEPPDPEAVNGSISEHAPTDMVMAGGAGGQYLYVIQSLDLVIVRQGEGTTFKNREFFALLFPEIRNDREDQLENP